MPGAAFTYVRTRSRLGLGARASCPVRAIRLLHLRRLHQVLGTDVILHIVLVALYWHHALCIALGVDVY
jgi:hypothetical protein